MASFTGGEVGFLGITNSFLTQLGGQATQTGVQQAIGSTVGPVWQGAGQSFLGTAGQAVVGNLAGSAVNIGLNSFLKTTVKGPNGLSLTSGANFLASTITPYVTSQLAAGINQNIQQTLQSAGPFGSLLSTVGTGLTNQAINSVTNGIFGNITGSGRGQNYLSFPGASDSDPDATYKGGPAYNLGDGQDVVFSIMPANEGPQTEGISQAVATPTTIGAGEIAGATSLYSGAEPINSASLLAKASSMGLTASSFGLN